MICPFKIKAITFFLLSHLLDYKNNSLIAEVMIENCMLKKGYSVVWHFKRKKIRAGKVVEFCPWLSLQKRGKKSPEYKKRYTVATLLQITHNRLFESNKGPFKSDWFHTMKELINFGIRRVEWEVPKARIHWRRIFISTDAFQCPSNLLSEFTHISRIKGMLFGKRNYFCFVSRLKVKTTFSLTNARINVYNKKKRKLFGSSRNET